MKTNEGITFRLADGTAKDLETYIEEKTDFFETTETDCNKLPVVEGTFYNPNGFTTNIPTETDKKKLYITQKIANMGTTNHVAYQECIVFDYTPFTAFTCYRTYNGTTGNWNAWTHKPIVFQTTGNSEADVMSQKAVTDIFAKKTGGYPEMIVGKAETATKDENGNTITSYYLPKNGPDLVVGQTLSALVSGKSYLDCSITATVFGGTFYLYNCTGTVTVAGSSTKVYATNCPSLTINSSYSATVFRDGVGLLYDKDSTNSSLNWGYPSGIKKSNGKISKNFSAYKHLIIEAMLSDYAMGLAVVGRSGTITSMSGSGNYFGIMEVYTLDDSIQVATSREWNIFCRLIFNSKLRR